MDIQTIKEQLGIGTVLTHYGIKTDNNHRALCPFHNDKTPSLQLYPKTGTYCCFSSNCRAGTGDVIAFIGLKEGCSKHEAIVKAKTLLGVGREAAVAQQKEAVNKAPAEALTQTFQRLREQLPGSRKVLAYLKSRSLSATGDNMGSNHQSSIGGKTTYHYPKLKNCVVFPLRNPKGSIVSLYGRSLSKGHYYLENRKGLYPGYPQKETTWSCNKKLDKFV